MKENYDIITKNFRYYENNDKPIKYFYNIRNYQGYQEIYKIVKIPFSRRGIYYSAINHFKTLDDVIYEFSRNGCLVGLKMIKHNNSFEGFMTACIFGNYTVVKYFIKCGINVNHVNEYGTTGLICAIVNNHYKIAKLLITKGCDTHHVDIFGQTYLHHAAELLYPNLKMIQMLIDAGINIFYKDNNNYSALDLVKRFSVFDIPIPDDRKQIIQLLEKNEIVFRNSKMFHVQ